MTIRVKYFASLSELLGRREDQLVTSEALTVADVWSRLCPDLPAPENTLIAVNLEYRDWHHLVQDGDEVAFFPPVTGG